LSHDLFLKQLGNICGGSFSDRFALKRHNNIHQKYGQTAPGEHLDDPLELDEDDEMLKEEDEDDESSMKEEMTLMA
jgi:hypothetical protein